MNKYLLSAIMLLSLSMTSSAFAAAPVLSNLDTDSVAWAGVGNTINLDDGGNATVSDAEFDALNGGLGDYNGATLTIKRSASAISTDVLSFDTAGASFTVNGSDLESGGQAFASFTNASGQLTINFNSAATFATTALVQDVVQHILYLNNTPAADAIIRFSLNDGVTTTDADVTVTSDSVYITNTTDTAVVDLSNGVSFSEAVAIALADVSGSQTLIFSNTFASNTMTLAGNLAIDESVSIDTSDAAALTLTGSTITLGNGLTFTVINSGNLSIASTLAGAGTLSKSGAGTLTFTGTNTSRTGPTTILAGAISIDSDNNLDGGSASVLTLNGGQLAVFISGGSDGSPVTQIINNSIVLGAGGGSFDVTGGGGRNIANLSGVISGSGSLTKIGNSVLQISGNNSFTGATSVTAGGLIVSNNNALGATSASTTVSSGAALRLTSGLTLSEPLILNGTGKYIDLVNYGALGVNASSNSTVSGAITLASNTYISAVTGSTLQITSAISGTGTLTKTDGGTLTLAGNNSYSSSATIAAGKLRVEGSTAVPDNIPLEVASGATLEFGNDDNLGPISGAGTIDMQQMYVGFSQNTDSTFSGVIIGTNTGKLTKNGTGTLTLSGNNTYGGNTVISGGSLNVTGALANANAVTVNNGGALRGTGSVFATSSTNTVTIMNGGTLAPGVAGPGLLTINGNLTMASGGNLAADINGLTLGTDYDAVAVNGTVSVTGANVIPTHGYTSTLGDSYRLLINDGVDSINGTFSGLTEGANLVAAGNSTVLKAHYGATDGGATTGAMNLCWLPPQL